MKCAKCDGKGFIETSTVYSNRETPAIQQCSKCKDIRAYSNEIKRRMGKADRQEHRQNVTTEVITSNKVVSLADWKHRHGRH